MVEVVNMDEFNIVMLYIPHLVTLLMIVMVLFYNFQAMCLLSRVEMKPYIKVNLFMLMIWQLGTMIAFVINQLYWVFDYQELVGMNTSLKWLVYDYFNKLFHLSVIVMIKEILKQELMKNCQ